MFSQVCYILSMGVSGIDGVGIEGVCLPREGVFLVGVCLDTPYTPPTPPQV